MSIFHEFTEFVAKDVTLENLRDYLNTTDRKSFQVRNVNSCPIACFLDSQNNELRISVGVSGSSINYCRVPHNKDIMEFIRRVDSSDTCELSKHQVLDIVNKLIEDKKKIFSN